MNHPRWSILISLLFCSASLLAQTGSISGTITDSETSEPVPSANVLIKGTQVGTTTDLDGAFELRGVDPGSYMLVVSSVGFEGKEVTVAVVSGQTAQIQISLAQRSVEMGDVTVLGASLRSEKITDAPASVTVLDAREIELNSVSGQVPKLLETQPGVDIVQSGEFDYNINTRGFNSSLNRRLLVLLDGRDLAVAFLGSQEWNGLSVPAEDLGKIELIRGPGSALYGANAFNGVLNILTPSPKSMAGGKITLAGGEVSTFRSDFRYAGVAEQWSYKINAGRAQSDTWNVSRLTFPFEYEGFNPFLNTEVVPVDQSTVASTYGSARVDYDFGGGAAAVAEGGLTQVENAILVTGIGRVQVPKATKPWGRINYSSGSWFVQAWGAGRNSLEPQVSLSTGLPLEEKSFIGQLDLQYRFDVMDDRMFVILGGAHRYQSVDTDGTLTLDAHHDNSSSLYGQLEYRFVRELKAVAAARWDRSTLHDDQVSPKFALVFSPSPAHTIRGTFNQAFQAPNYSELFLYVKHPTRNLAYLGNDNLKVETITGYELGYSGVFGNLFYVTLDLYFNQLEDFITDLAPGTNPAYPGQAVLPGDSTLRTIWSYGNAGKVDEKGFEVAVNVNLTRTIGLNANYAFFDFDVKEVGANDVLIPNTPSDKFNVGISYHDGPLEAAVSYKYVPSYDWAAGIYQGRILAYGIVNLSGSYDITSYLEAGLNVTNLLDNVHYQIFGGSLIYRRAVLSLTARF
ncbi:MAG: TonB-dependent receptor [Ignavibacteria bacterium]|nr:TonB-dependent receptor [Ignavibacteria bacterium]